MAVARYGPLAGLVLAALLLILAELLTLREIVAVTVVPPGGRTSGGPHHGYALAVLAVTALGAVALAIALIVDLPALDETGLIGRTYDLAKAHPGAGFWVELAGALGLLLGGALVVRGQVVRARERDAERRRSRRE